MTHKAPTYVSTCTRTCRHIHLLDRVEYMYLLSFYVDVQVNAVIKHYNLLELTLPCQVEKSEHDHNNINNNNSNNITTAATKQKAMKIRKVLFADFFYAKGCILFHFFWFLEHA